MTLTDRQRKVLQVLQAEGRCSSLHLATRLRKLAAAGGWTLDRTRIVLRQLKEKGLVEYDAAWRVTDIAALVLPRGDYDGVRL